MSGPPIENSQRLLEYLGISEPGDIDIEAIAQFCGATVRYEALRGCEARVLGYQERAIITVNNASPRSRQRFGAAHELCHWVNDRGRVAFECEERTFTTAWEEDRRENREHRANEYAADLLLPLSMFKPRARNVPLTLGSVRALAEVFQTSLTATAIRLIQHGSFPGMVVCNSPQRRLWFARSPDLPQAIWPQDEPGHQTLAYELLHGVKAAFGPVEVFASEWTTHPEAHRYVVKEDSIKIMTDLVLSVIWWEDEKQLVDLSDDG